MKDEEKILSYYKDLIKNLSQEDLMSLDNILKFIKLRGELNETEIIHPQLRNDNSHLIKFLFEKILPYGGTVRGVGIIPYSVDFHRLMLLKEVVEDEIKIPSFSVIKSLGEENGFVIKYDYDNNRLLVNNFEVPFTKGGKRASMIGILLKSKRNANRDWFVDEIVKKLDGKDNIDAADKNRFNALCEAINNRINSRTGIKEFILFDSNHARINPKYLTSLAF